MANLIKPADGDGLTPDNAPHGMCPVMSRPIAFAQPDGITGRAALNIVHQQVPCAGEVCQLWLTAGVPKYAKADCHTGEGCALKLSATAALLALP